jgi:ABC-type polysaccharide/polyol phosphate export permease
LLAPFLLTGIVLIADGKLMRNEPSSVLSRVIVGIITLAMFAAAIGLFAL